MSISGLVVTLAPDPGAAEEALQDLRGLPQLKVGVRNGARVAVVAETGSVREDRDLLDRIGDLPGVRSANVVFVEVGS